MVVPVMCSRDLMETDFGVAVFLLLGFDEDDRGPRSDHAALPCYAQRRVYVVAGHHDGAQVGALNGNIWNSEVPISKFDLLSSPAIP